MNSDKKILFLLIGVALMSFSSLMFIFIAPLAWLQIVGCVLMFLIGFGCCIAGTEANRESEDDLSYRSEEN